MVIPAAVVLSVSGISGVHTSGGCSGEEQSAKQAQESNSSLHRSDLSERDNKHRENFEEDRFLMRSQTDSSDSGKHLPAITSLQAMPRRAFAYRHQSFSAHILGNAQTVGNVQARRRVRYSLSSSSWWKIGRCRVAIQYRDTGQRLAAFKHAFFHSTVEFRRSTTTNGVLCLIKY